MEPPAEPVVEGAPVVDEDDLEGKPFEELIDQFSDFEDEVEVGADAVLAAEEKAKKKKSKTRVVEYDPDLDEMVVHRRRKRDDDEWGEFEEY